MKKGKLIAIEGIDGSGKHTQAELLSNFLRANKRDCIVTSEPVYESPTGKLIGEILHSKHAVNNFLLQSLFTIDRGLHVSELINPAMESGKDVIADRYLLSTISYSMALGIQGGELDLIKQGNRIYPYPDITFIINVDPKISVERMKLRSEKEGRKIDKFESKADFLGKVRAAYLRLQKDKDYKNIFVVDGDRKAEEINKEIVEIFGRYFR